MDMTWCHSNKAVVILTLFALPAPAQQATAPDYAKVVAPVLAKYCAGCHNDEDREGDFSLESYKSLQSGTEDGPAFLPGDSAGSRIIRLITGAASPKMPPKGHPRPSEQDIATVKAWIDAGAPAPEGEQVARLALIVPQIEPKTTTRPITALDASHDGRWLAVGRYGEVRLHALHNGQIADEPQGLLGPLPGKVTSVHFTGDSKRLVTASGVAGVGGLASIWDVDTGEIVREFPGHRDLLHDAELSPDGRLLATCGYEPFIQFWDATTGELVRRLEGHNGPVYDLAFSPDGRFLVSGSADDTCKVWRVADGLRMDTLAQPLKEVSSCAFTPDGQFVVATGADNNVRVWKFISRERPDINPMVVARFAHEAPILKAALTPDGSKLITLGADRSVKVWDTSDYAEIEAWQDQPDVAAALAVASDGDSFHVGRMDGSIARFIVPQRRAENAPTLAVGPTIAALAGEMSAMAEVEPNDTPQAAQVISLPARITGKIEGTRDNQADFDLYGFHANAGEEWVIEIDAARSKSRLDSFVEVLDASGARIERVRLQAVRDSYFTFRGKDNVQFDDFRVFNWEEMGLNEYLYANGEIVKLWLYPRGPDSGFMVYPGQGKRWGQFDTTPLAHALGEPCYIVEPHPPGTVLKPNGLPVISLYFENDDEAHQTLGKDSRLLFTAAADGDYLVKVRDVRGYQGPDFTYTLMVRPRRPDFRATLTGANPTLAPGMAREFAVKLERLDGFKGPVRVEVEGLPPGFFATTVEVEPGQIEAQGVIWTADDAAAPTPDNAKASKVRAIASIGGREVVHDANNLGEIKWSDKTPTRVAIAPSESGPRPTRSDQGAPLEFAIRPGETIQLEVKVERNGHKGLVSLGNVGAGRNLPFGCYVDNLGLNGLLILEDQDARTFFVTADKSVPVQDRLFHLKTDVGGGTASRPVLLRVRP
jgi:WD40 repeat protein